MNEPSLQQPTPIRWRLGIYAALAMAFLAMLPQLHLWALRGSNWQGTYVSFDFDEVAYSAYLNALISGRPRLSDPYTGRDDAPNNPRPESIHSIQFLPAYAIATPARALGLSASTAFILIRLLAAAAATLALFWLLILIGGDERLAAGGAIIVLCLGGLAGEPHDAWRIITFRGTGESLPFLRRYVPALVFPLLFVFAGLTWQALNTKATKIRLLDATLAGLVLAVLIFSYFFLWTTAVAWLCVIALLWLLACRETRKALPVMGIIATCFAIAMLPYAFLLSGRAQEMDAAQLLTRSRSVVVSLPVIIGVGIFLALAAAVWRGRLTWRDPAVVFAASFALLPAITFNQQVISGLLLQPVHYGRYSANYSSVLSAVLACTLIWRGKCAHRHIKRAVAVITIAVFGWCLLENGARIYRMGPAYAARDEAQRVAWRLRELRQGSEQSPGQSAPVVLCTDLLLADALPNEAPQPILWTPHLFVFSGSTATENRERLYRQLYYSGVDESQFESLAGSSSFLQLAIFGWERMNEKPHAPLITNRDVQQETQLFAAYTANFDSAQAASPRLAFVIVPELNTPSLTSLDLWYTRDEGEHVGGFIIYRVELRH